MAEGVRVGTAYLEVTASARGAVRQVQQDFGRAMPGVGKQAGTSMGKGMVASARGVAGPLAALFAADAAKDFFMSAVTGASDLNETINKSNVIFGQNAGAIRSWAANSERAFGLTEQEALNAAASFGDMFTQIGFSSKAATNMSKATVQMSADLGSFNNLPTADVQERISAALRGEYDSLQALIPNINAARVEQQAMATTGKSNAKELTAQEKAAATLAIINKDGARASGDFARTQGGLANQVKIARAQLTELAVKTGTALLPIVTRFMNFLTKTGIPAFGRLGDVIRSVVRPAFTSIADFVRPAVTTLDYFFDVLSGRSTSQAGRSLPWASATISAAFAVRRALREVSSFISAVALPALASLGDNVRGSTGPALARFGGFLQTTVLPALARLGGFVLGTVVPALLRFGQVAAANIVPPLRQLATFVQTQVVPRLVGIGTAVRGLAVVVLPIIRQIAGELLSRWSAIRPVVQTTFQAVAGIIRDVFSLIGFIVTRGLDRIRNIITTVTAVIRFIWSRWGTQITTIVGSAFETVVKVIGGAMRVVGGVVKLITGLITGDWRKAGQGIRQIVSGLRDVLVAIWRNIRTQVTTILSTLTAGLRTRFGNFLTYTRTTLSSGLAKVKNFILNPVRDARDALKDILDKITEKFSDGVTAIGTAWDKLKGVAKDPIRFVVDTVLNNGLLAAFRKISGVVGYEDGKNLTVSLPKGFAKGGIIPGYTPGRDVHRFYSPTGGVLDLSGGEPVLRPEAGRVLGPQWVHGINGAAASGGVGGVRRFLGGVQQAFAQGGFLGGLQPTPGRANRHASGYPWATWAGDIPAAMGTPVKAWRDGVVAAVRSLTTSYGKHMRVNHGGQQTLYAHMSRMVARIGQTLTQGQTLGYVGSTGNSTGPHLHFELKGGTAAMAAAGTGAPSEAPSGATLLATLRDRFAGAVNRLTEAGSTPWAQMLKSSVGSMKDRLLDRAKSFVSEFVGNTVGKVVGAISGSLGSKGRAEARLAGLRLGASSVGTYPGHQPSMNKAWDFMATGRTGQNIADHLAVNRKRYGISYLIWNRRMLRDYGKPGIPAGSWAPYFDGNSSNPNRAHTNHVHASFYAAGTRSAAPGWAVVGERGPELMRLRGGEDIRSHRESRQMVGAGGVTINGGVHGYSADDVADAIERRRRRQAALSPTWAH